MLRRSHRGRRPAHRAGAAALHFVPRPAVFLAETLEPRRLLAVDTFSNTGPIAVPGSDTQGQGNPFPSTINVAGLTGVVTKATVRLTGFSHASPDDVDVLLVAPNGHNLLLMSDVGGATAASGLNLTFDDAAAAGLPDEGPLATGTFRPTNADGGSNDTLASPAPAVSTATTLAIFEDGQPNGAWQLFVRDDAIGNTGVIAGGWTLTLTTASAPVFSSAAEIDVPATGTTMGPASPYPSTINVAGLSGTVTRVTVTLRRLSHTFPDDVNVMLEAPGGRNLLFLSDVGAGPGTGDGQTVVEQTFTFDDAAAAEAPDSGPLLGGVYRPSNAGGNTADDFPAPAPVPSTADRLNVFNGISPNGAWRLWAADDASIDSGEIAGGWSLRIDTTANSQPPVVANVGQSTLVYTEDAAPAVVSPAATVTDPNSPDLAGGSLFVSLATNATDDDRLSVRNQGAGAGQIGVNGDSVTFAGAVIGTLSGGEGDEPLLVNFLTGATLAAVQALVRNVTFGNVSQIPSVLARSIRFVVADGDGFGSAPASRNATVTSINDPPVLTAVTGPHSVPRNGVLPFSRDRGTAASVADVDVPSDQQVRTRLELPSGGGVLSLGTTNNLVFVTGDGVNDATMEFRGTINQTNSALNGLRFTPAAGFAGQAVIDITVNDEGRTGNGGAQSDSVSLQVNVTPPDSTPPAVAEVLLSGSAWTDGFLGFLQAGGLGAGGFLVPGGAAQLTVLPWANLNRITIRFTEDVNLQIGDLQVRGVASSSYAFSSFTYTPATRTAVWGLTTFGAEKLLLDLNATDVNTRVTNLAGLALDGEWADGADSYPSGNGTAGGDFEFRVDVLPGDVNRNGGVVNSIDLQQTRNRQFLSPANPGTPPTTYTAFFDVDGNAFINSLDVQQVRNRQFTGLPEGNPTLVAPLPGGRDEEEREGNQSVLP